jgi:hypothetical protein
MGEKREESRIPTNSVFKELIKHPQAIVLVRPIL